MTYLCIFLYVIGIPMGAAQGVYIKATPIQQLILALTWPIVSFFVIAGFIAGHKKVKELNS